MGYIDMFCEMALSRIKSNSNFNLDDVIKLAQETNCFIKYVYNDNEYYYIDPNVLNKFVCQSNAFENVILMNNRISNALFRSLAIKCSSESLTDIIYNDNIYNYLVGLLIKQQETLSNLLEFITSVAEYIDDFNFNINKNDGVISANLLNGFYDKDFSRTKSFQPKHIQGSSRHVFNSEIVYKLSKYLDFIVIDNFFNINHLYLESMLLKKQYSENSVTFETGDDFYNRYDGVAANVLRKLMKENRQHDDVTNDGLARIGYGWGITFRKKISIPEVFKKCFCFEVICTVDSQDTVRYKIVIKELI